jgi:uncharacterized OB-fold protein
MTDVTRPLPIPDELTRFFWEGARERRLLILRCDDCTKYVHPPAPVCPNCRSWNLTPAEVSGRGVVYTFTVATQAFAPYFADKLPYVLVSIALEEQDDIRLFTSLVDCDPSDVRAGLPVEVVFEDVADDVTLPFFRPVQEA